MCIDVDSIIWEWTPKERWSGKKISINEEGFVTIKEQQDHIMEFEGTYYGFYNSREIVLYSCCGCTFIFVVFIIILEKCCMLSYIVPFDQFP